MKSRSGKIGVFDSGLGGLTVLRKLLVDYPADYIYIADTANVPFGSKTVEQIRQFSFNMISFLQDQGIDTCVIACHTAATTLPLALLQEKYPAIQFFTVIEPVVDVAVLVTKNNNIGIIATPATIASHLHKRLLLEKNGNLTIVERASSRLVPFIEGPSYCLDGLRLLLQEDLEIFVQAGIDTLIIGSTHYSIIKHEIQKIVGNNVTLIAPEDWIIPYLPPIRHKTPSTVCYFVTGDPITFQQKGAALIGLAMTTVNHCVLGGKGTLRQSSG